MCDHQTERVRLPECGRVQMVHVVVMLRVHRVAPGVGPESRLRRSVRYENRPDRFRGHQELPNEPWPASEASAAWALMLPIMADELFVS